MRELFKDREHLVRMAGLFGVGLLVFVVLRGVLIPADFGELGHYRASALEDNRSVELKFAGRAACEECHDDVAEERVDGAHHGRRVTVPWRSTRSTPARSCRNYPKRLSCVCRATKPVSPNRPGSRR